MVGYMRINKFLADCGVGSRRFCDKLVEEGKVTVNGKICETGYDVKADDSVCVNGKKIFRATEN